MIAATERNTLIHADCLGWMQSQPDNAVDEAIERAQSGEKITVAIAKEITARHRQGNHRAASGASGAGSTRLAKHRRAGMVYAGRLP